MEDAVDAQVVPVEVKKISVEDKAKIDICRLEARLANEQAQKAELLFKHTILGIYRKYGIADEEVIQEDGTVVKGAK